VIATAVIGVVPSGFADPAANEECIDLSRAAAVSMLDFDDPPPRTDAQRDRFVNGPIAARIVAGVAADKEASTLAGKSDHRPQTPMRIDAGEHLCAVRERHGRRGAQGCGDADP
jgi:hypothetical protein